MVEGEFSDPVGAGAAALAAVRVDAAGGVLLPRSSGLPDAGLTEATVTGSRGCDAGAADFGAGAVAT